MSSLARALVASAMMVSVALAAGVEIDASADFERVHEGAQRLTGKFYARGKKIRTDSSPRGQPVTVIMDAGSGKMFIVASPTACMEQPLSDDARRKSLWIPDPASKEELVGTETIDGHPADKYKVMTRSADAAIVHYVWRAKDLKGFPVRVSDETGTSVTSFKNIALAKPDAKLFQPPAGCKQMPSLQELQQRFRQQQGMPRGR